MKTKILIIALLVVVLTVCLCVPVFAYADTSSDIVNFNQLFLITNIGSITYGGITRVNTAYTYKISGTATTSDWLWAEISITSGHIYYINTPNSDTINKRYNFGSTYYSNSNDYLFTASSSQLQYALMFVNGTTYNITVQPYLIDLTLMYGSGSELSLSECREVFISDYYAYNTGTSISLNGLNSYSQGYSQGVVDTLGSTTYDVLLDDFYNNSFALASIDSNYNTNLVKNTPYTISGQYVFGLSASNVSWSSTGASYINNNGLLSAIGFNINHVVPIGSTLSVKFQGYSLANNYNDTSSANIYSNLYLATFDGTSFTKFLDLGTGLMSVSDYRSFTVAAPSNAESLYLISNGSINCTYLSINVQYTNSDILIDSIYKSGQDSVLSQYQEGGVQYNRIYNAGYSAGLEADTPYTFGYLMSSVIEAPLNAVLSIFNFDFLGVNFKNVITLILTLCIIIAIVRLFMGGKE